MKIVRTMDDLRDGIKARKLAPDRGYLKKKFPGAYREEVTPSGKREWVIDVKTHDRSGNLTAEGREFTGLFHPFMKAEAERGRKLGARMPQAVALRDAEGRTRMVHPELADAAARRNGWHSGERPRGNPVQAGPQGMLFRLIRDRWEPLGVYNLGTRRFGPSRVPKRSLQQDPDGAYWRWLSGMWTEVS